MPSAENVKPRKSLRRAGSKVYFTSLWTKSRRITRPDSSSMFSGSCAIRSMYRRMASAMKPFIRARSPVLRTQSRSIGRLS
jgi:hypothetical protein